MDTIFARATAPGKAGVAIIRISGPQAFAAGAALVGTLPEHRRASLREIRAEDGQVIDSALVITFPNQASFTGEDTLELQVHGSMAIVAAVEAELASLPDLRRAEPGEFTRRALENARLDLAQVEGLADLIDSETEAQRVQAQRIFSGHLSEKVLGWRGALIRASALLEATLDFADEDVPVDVYPEVVSLLRDLEASLTDEIKGFSYAERIRTGFEVAIIGPPNAGKSTLLNAIAKRPAALTSEIAGTTRDVIEVRIDIDGLPVTLLDTAGLRETDDPLEAAGVALTKARAATADLRILISDQCVTGYWQGETIVVSGKADETGSADGVSGKTGQGLDVLLSKVGSMLRAKAPKASLLTRERHKEAVSKAVSSVEEALALIATGGEPEIVSAAISEARVSLEGMIGRVDVEDILGEIFSSFCIGK